MKRMRRWIGILLAVAMLAALAGFPAGAAEREAESPLSLMRQIVREEAPKQQIDTTLPAEEDIVVLIVELEGQTGVERSRRATAAEAAQDEQAMASVQRAQESYIQAILEINPEAEISNRYGLLFNGFSVKTRYGDKERIQQLKGVMSVVVSNTYTKSASSAQQMTQVTQVWEKYRYDGRDMVVAVIDSGIDYRHKDMVLSDGVSGRLTQQQVQQFIDSQEQPHGQYFTEKVPYGYNYADKNDDVIDRAVDDPGYAHGMHIAGIIGANCQSREEIEGYTGVRGIAPECQLLALKIFSNDGIESGAFEADIIAAIEDAVALKADVINMSLALHAGFHDENDGQQKAIQAAKEAGIIVVAAGGNTAYSTYPADDEQLHPENYDQVIDNGTIAAPGISTDSIQVASLENHRQVTYQLTAWVGSRAEKMAYVMSDHNPRVLPSRYAVEYCGLGYPEDFEGKNLQGKIALIKRGEIEFKDKKLNAQQHGAVAVIIYNSDGDDEYLNNISTDEAVVIPTVFMKNSDGEKLRGYAGVSLAISFDGQAMAVESSNGGEMSYFSSWGPGPDLTFKPDVTAIGGQIWSTVNDNGYQSMSGTSMACPNAAGIAVLLKQSIKEKGIQCETAAEEVQLVKTMLMNTCKPQRDPDDRFYSPRRQGAGLVSAKDALENMVLVTWEGQPSIQLKTIEESRKIRLELRNFGTHSVAYRPVALGKDEGNISFGQDEISVAPGATAALDVQIFINAGRAQNDYVEGFISFVPVSGRGNEPTIGLPFLGFYGDWANLKIIDDPVYQESSVFLATGLYTTNRYGYFTEVVPLGDHHRKPEYYAINPEDSQAYDNVMPEVSLLRNVKQLTIDVSDANGAVLTMIDQQGKLRKEIPMDQEVNAKVNFNWVWNGGIYDKESGGQKWAEEGQYYVNIRATADYPGAEEQVLSMPLKIDKTAPTVRSSAFFTKNQTGFIEIEAQDEGVVDSGIEHFVFLVDGVPYEDPSGKKVFELGRHDDGKYRMPLTIPDVESQLVHTVDIGVTDHAGNMSASRAYVIYAPQSALQVIADRQKYGVGEAVGLQFQWEGQTGEQLNAQTDHYEIYVDSLEHLAGSTAERQFTVQKPLTAGSHSIIVQAVDNQDQVVDTNYVRIGVEGQADGAAKLQIENLTAQKNLQNGETFCARLKAANLDQYSQGVALILCLYEEEEHRMVDCAAVEKRLAPQGTGYLTATIQVPETGRYQAKIMVWDGVDTMKNLVPYMEVGMK